MRSTFPTFGLIAGHMISALMDSSLLLAAAAAGFSVGAALLRREFEG
jgi:hypothetical protein